MSEERIKSNGSVTSGVANGFESLQLSLRNYLRRRVAEEAVDDLLQDIFVKALNAIVANKTLRNLPGWLYTVARTSVVDYYRSKNVSQHISLNDNLDDLPDGNSVNNFADHFLSTQSEANADDERLSQELASCLRPLVEQLPVIYRTTLIEIDFNKRTMKSFAEESGLSISAIKSRASRGRYMLKEKLLQCCHVEMSDGKVTDYYNRRSSSVCSNKC